MIPSANTFAVLIEVAELSMGTALVVAASVWLTRWSRLSDRARLAVAGLTMLASLAAIFMALNFHVANGGNHPWLIPKDGFDERSTSTPC